ATATLNLTFPALPDLRVGNISVDEASAGTLQSGGPLTVHWQTRNDGAAPVTGSFHERVVVTNTTTGQSILSTTVLYDAFASGPIAVRGPAPRASAFPLPDGPAGAGPLSVAVTTDVNNEVVEGFNTSAAETNNTTTASFTAALRPYPDLVVSALAVNPTSVQTGQAVTVSWHTDNVGS